MDKVKAHATSVKVVLLLCFGRDNLLLLTLEEPHAARQAGPASLICAMRAALRGHRVQLVLACFVSAVRVRRS